MKPWSGIWDRLGFVEVAVVGGTGAVIGIDNVVRVAVAVVMEVAVVGVRVRVMVWSFFGSLWLDLGFFGVLEDEAGKI